METALEATQIVTGVLLSRIVTAPNGEATVTEAITLTHDEAEALIVALAAFQEARRA